MRLGRIDIDDPQETVLVVGPSGVSEFYISRQDSVFNHGPIGSVDFKLPKFSAGKIADIYSQIRSKAGGSRGTFVFEGWSLTPPPLGMMEALRRKHEGEIEFIGEA